MTFDHATSSDILTDLKCNHIFYNDELFTFF